MSTYDPKQVLSDYAKGAITSEMAVGHGLQHITKLYDAQASATSDRRADQTRLDALEKRVHVQQATIDRLTAFLEKVLAQSKKRRGSSLPKSDLP